WAAFVALSWYRKAAIAHGVYARALQGNASSTNAQNYRLVFCRSVETCLSMLDKFST
ncbi:MAG: hypothetical protein SGPRY_013012, partial [Prymnesium sp.]